MKGLAAEFERFRATCLEAAPPSEVENVRLIFMTGALAASQRLLDILQADLPDCRKAALVRRVMRECVAFQKEVHKLSTKDERPA